MEQTGKADGVQPILNDLYAIRAGMSVISQKKDDLDAKYKETVSFIQYSAVNIVQPIKCVDNIVDRGIEPSGTIIPSEDRMELLQYTETIDFNGLEKKYESYTEVPALSSNSLLADFSKKYCFNTQTEINGIENAVLACKTAGKQKTGKAAACLGTVFGIFCLACTIVFIVSMIIELPTAVTFATGGGIVLFFILTAILNRKKRKTAARRKRLENIVQSCEDAIAAIKIFSTESRKKYNDLSAYIPTVTQDCNYLYQTLKTQCSLIDPRDWKYVDTLIFYFETGRADTMKEALQHLDHEIQTRQIINTVVRATEYLAETIRIGIQQITERLAHIQVLQAAQLQQQMMQTALLNKIASSSEQLASDVSYMNSQIASINAKL